MEKSIINFFLIFLLPIFLILYTLLEYFYNVSEKKKNIEKKSIKRHF